MSAEISILIQLYFLLYFVFTKHSKKRNFRRPSRVTTVSSEINSNLIQMEVCDGEKRKMSDNLYNFGNTYFYALRLNKKLCKGIFEISQEIRLDNTFHNHGKKVFDWFHLWGQEECTKTSYDKMMSEIMGENFVLHFKYLAIIYGP